jgi:DivIVA domain-containing protein
LWQVGTLLAPGDAPSVAAHAATGTHVIGQLKVAGKSPYLAWPMASLLVLALVYFAWPGSFVQPRHADPTATEHDAEAGPAVPGGGRHQLSELPPDRRRLVDEIRSARFKPTRIRQGYAMGAVDALLDGAADTLSRGESLGAALDAPLPTVTWREGYDRAEVGAFLARLRDSADATDARG